jgi:hypothetical protein
MTSQPEPMNALFERFLSTVDGALLPDIDGGFARPTAETADATATSTYAFCEPSYATSYSREHIRIVDGDGLKTGGGIRNRPLCGDDLMFGWDNEGEVTRANVSAGLASDANAKVCPRCAALWSLATDTPLVLG